MSEPRDESPDDITHLLKSWPFVAGAPQLRFLVGIGGVRRIQARLETGILQFEVDGRPDGTRPDGCDSWMEYWAIRGGRFSAEGVGAILAEVSLYHQRAVAFLLLDDLAACVRDCDRNLAAIKSVLVRGETEVDTSSCQLLYLATVLLRTRAEASMCVRLKDTQGALAAIDCGIAALQSPGAHLGQSSTWDSPESAFLRAMRDALVPKLPSSQRVDLETRLKRALRLENYELAVILRNELRQIGQ